MKKQIIIAVAFCIIAACNTHKDSITDSANNPMSMSVLYSYYATEYKALTIQAYNLAGQKLIGIAEANDDISRMAVVLDIDETVLDNSPYQAAAIVEGFEYPEQWNEWCNQAVARTIPGAVKFLTLADSLGFHIYYISNRKHDYVYESTLRNLKAVGSPQVLESNIMLRQAVSESNPDPSDKELRRQQVRNKGFDIVMLIGDNIGDFYTDNETGEERLKKVEELRKEFGSRFVVLPNAMYGNWTSAMGLNGSSEALIAKLHEMAMKIER